ncbi:MAG TPA: serine hydrolase [Blastocatellia bacterium]|nr:serine hydrolase [Blastocatellia bacterium]
MQGSDHYRNGLSRSILVLAVLLGLVAAGGSRTSQGSSNDLTTAIDDLLQKAYKPGEPGASVIVVKDGKVVFRKGYGKANLELGVAAEPEMIFRLGSVTKQFTAVAILMLAEQGKLSIGDEITSYLPDYPTNGQKITIQNLLTHTSGIKSYTSLPEWLQLWRKDMPLKELIDLFKDKPMDFAPGESWSYNNSGYVLLGAIIEKVSGQSYKDFVEKRIFAPLGMSHSFYDSTERVIAGRVSGYSKGKDGFVNCAYLSMTQPYAAGSLMSSVDDLALWDAALYTEKIVKQESLKRAWTPAVLNNGKPTHYGYGWAMNSYEGHRIVMHGGGINGFSTDAIRLPDDRIFVAVLTNRDTGEPSPDDIAFKIAAMMIGKPYQEPVAASLPSASLDQFVGVYRLNKDDVSIRRDGSKLMMSFGLGKVEIVPTSETDFYIKGSRTHLTFSKAESGVTGFVMHDNYGIDQEARKTDKPLPENAARPSAVVDPAVYEGYVGEYELAPGFSIVISKEGARLMAQATGQPKIELIPESKLKFFVKEVDARVEFVVNDSGMAISLVLHQGGQDLPAKKIK